MSRQQMLEKGVSASSPNPAKKFIEWKSSKKCFVYYDKEQQAEVELKLPLNFMFVQQSYTVGGYSKTKGGWYSNEVLDINSEKLVARTFTNTQVIAEGLYKDIKPTVIDSKMWDGSFYRVIYVIDTNKDLVALKIKGGVGYEFGEFYKANSKKLANHWISIKTFEDRTNGAVDYTVPVFDVGKEVKDTTYADEAWEVITEHIQNRNANLSLGGQVPDTDYANSAATHARVEKMEHVGATIEEEEELPF